MPSWLLALLIKPIAAMGIVVFYYFGIIKPIQWLDRRLPPSRWKDALFRERGTQRTAHARVAPDRLLQQDTIRGR